MEMELTRIPVRAELIPNQVKDPIFNPIGVDNPKPKSPFIEANTDSVSLSHLKEKCVIPVFTKDNEITLSHQEFIETALSSIATIFPNEAIDKS